MKVFLVEDSVIVRERIKETIGEVGGVVVGEAETEKDAINCIGVTRPDLVVIDLELAKGSGLGVLRRINQLKQFNPELKIVVLTNRERELYEKVCLAEGADYFLDKSRGYPLFVKLLESVAQVS